LLEGAAYVVVTYVAKLPVATYLADLKGITRAFLKKFMITVLPVAANETVWSLGVSIYTMVYAHISTEAIAAYNITATIDNLSFVLFIGIANASAIMIGNAIGAGEEEKAFSFARRSLVVGVMLAVLVGGSLILFAAPIFTLYKISAEAMQTARYILIVLNCTMLFRVSNMNIIVGILRSGGDTRFSLALDVGSVWLVGIPMALLGAFVLHLPIHWVVAMVMADEVTKATVGFFRYRSKKWINNLTRSTAEKTS
jgi:Na+-driven multidrug efflux pump